MIRSSAEIVFWIAAALCVVAEAAILRATFRSHRGEIAAEVPRASRGGEIMWAVIPALGLAAVLIATWRAIQS
ncbi:MAG TPA: hypothetical protein VM939_03890 [Gemmatimonadaceae bacterium]|nr:hypothetical protein [Gemmatimonadaceae bacterium]